MKAKPTSGGDPWEYWAEIRKAEQFKRQARGEFIRSYVKPVKYEWPARKRP